jgi:hypothetical protein
MTESLSIIETCLLITARMENWFDENRMFISYDRSCSYMHLSFCSNETTNGAGNIVCCLQHLFPIHEWLTTKDQNVTWWNKFCILSGDKSKNPLFPIEEYIETFLPDIL